MDSLQLKISLSTKLSPWQREVAITQQLRYIRYAVNLHDPIHSTLWKCERERAYMLIIYEMGACKVWNDKLERFPMYTSL